MRSQFKPQWGSNILSTHIPFVPCQLGIPFLSYDFLKIWPWKSKVKVMGEVTVQSHNVGLASYRLTSLSSHVNRPSHSWDTAFSKFDLENQGSGSYGFRKVWPKCCLIWQVFGPWANPYGANGQITHWGRVTHICIGKLTIIGLDNGLPPERHKAIISTNAGILLIGPLGTNFSEI